MEKLSETALTVLKKRYFIKGETTPKEMFHRVADFVAKGDGYANAKYYNEMSNLRFLPNSPCLMSAGTNNPMMSACFVLPLEDSMESIFSTLKDAAIIAKDGGGIGYDFSPLRPSGSPVKGTEKVSGGPISFMQIFNDIGHIIKQGGRRATAQMAILRCDHPDIMDFITCKDKDGDLSCFNISVAVTNSFMSSIKNTYGIIYQEGDDREIWDKICEQAWKNGEPGIIFIDTVNKKHPLEDKITATNPCGEQPLLPYEACCLGSINLSKFVSQYSIEGDPIVKWGELEDTIKIAVDFLNGIIDTQSYPLRKIEETVKENRKIGLGVMGWADMLFQMGIPYDSDKALDLAEDVMDYISNIADKHSIDNDYNNITTTTIAPTGTISMIAGCSGGIEPYFSREFTKNVMDGESFTYKKEGADEPHFRIASEISPEYHVRMQAAFQKHTDNAVSKTINMPSDAMVEDVKEVYMLAWKLGCKGITVYRDGSRDNQPLIKKENKVSGGMEDCYYENIADNLDKNIMEEAGKNEKHIIETERPTYLEGKTFKITTGCGNIYVTINIDSSNNPVELFATMGKTGGCASSQLQSIGRIASLALKAGVSLEAFMNTLKGIRCDSSKIAQRSILSCADGIAYAIEEFLSNENVAYPVSKSFEFPVTPLNLAEGLCPECDEKLYHESGCKVCKSCGFSKCG